MTHPQLAERLKLIEDAIAAGGEAPAIVQHATREWEAVAEFGSGTYWFSLCGVRGTATSGHGSALRSWIRLAHKRLEGRQ